MTNLNTSFFVGALMLTSFDANALDIRGIHLGDAWDTKVIEGKLHLEGDDIPTCWSLKPSEYKVTHKMVTSCHATVAMLGIKVSVWVGEENKKVKSVRFVIKRPDFDKFVNAYTTKYGSPTWNEVTPLQNGFGARYEQRRVAWGDGAQRLEVNRFRVEEGGKLDQEQAEVSLWLNAPVVEAKPNL